MCIFPRSIKEPTIIAIIPVITKANTFTIERNFFMFFVRWASTKALFLFHQHRQQIQLSLSDNFFRSMKIPAITMAVEIA